MRPRVMTFLLLIGATAGWVACAAEVRTSEPRPVRNLILMLVDGMGPQQLALLLDYSAAVSRPAAVARLAAGATLGLVRTASADALVADSAAAASQLATGVPARSETIGLDANGNPVATILERARDAGKATGLITDTRLTHATPAAFAAHRAHRSMERAIAADLLSARVDVMLGGGSAYFPPATAAQLAHTYVATDLAALLAAPEVGPVLGLFAPKALAPALQASTVSKGASDIDAAHREPSLAELAIFALKRLDRDPDGFFLLLESGQVDWAAHANDAGWLLHELLRFDATLAAVLDWLGQRQDTLLVVTADHETGGFGLSYSNFARPQPLPLEGSAFADRPYAPTYNFVPPAALARLGRQSGTYLDAMHKFAARPPQAQTAAALVADVAATTGWELSHSEATQALACAGSGALAGAPSEPHAAPPADPAAQSGSAGTLDAAFYVYGPEKFTACLGRVLQRHTHAVWATGTHTHAPVPLLASGPPAHAARFAGIHDLPRVGRLLQRALGVAP